MVSLKLLIDKSSNKVLYAEAGKDFVDFLFSLLRLPLGCVMKLLNSNVTVGSIGKIYASVQNLGSSYMLPSQDSLLMPTTPTMPLLNPQSTSSSPSPFSSWKFDSGSPEFDSGSLEFDSGSPEFDSGSPEFDSRSLEFDIGSPEFLFSSSASHRSPIADGHVKDGVTYMVTDDLEVTPISTISMFTLMNRFNVKDVGHLEEKVVNVGRTQGLALLKASMGSNSVLTDVFLRG